MEAIHSRCAGLDVHKKTVVACVITPGSKGGWHRESRTFTTMTRQLLELSDWLSTHGCTHVAMESLENIGSPSSTSSKLTLR